MIEILDSVQRNLRESETSVSEWRTALKQDTTDLATQVSALQRLTAGESVENLTIENCRANISGLRAAISNKLKLIAEAEATKMPGMRVDSSELRTLGQLRVLASYLGVEIEEPARGKQTIISNPDQTAWVITRTGAKSASTGVPLFKIEHLVKADPVTESVAPSDLLYTDETKPDVSAQLKAGIKAPFVAVAASPLDGADIALSVSFQPKERWNNGIFHNSAYFRMWVQADGTLDMFQTPAKGLKLRKMRVKSVEEAVSRINAFIEMVQSRAPADWDGGGLTLMRHVNPIPGL